VPYRKRSGGATSGARRGFVAAITLVVVILAVQLATTIVSAVLASRDATEATRQLFSVVGDVTIERVGRYSQAAEDAVGQSVLALERANPVTDVDAIAADLYARIDGNPQVGSIKVGWANGDYVELTRESGGYALHVVGTAPSRVTELRHYDRSLALLSGEPDVENADYDPRLRPWYIEAQSATGTAWTDPYLLFSSQTPAVSAVRAARVGNDVVAVVAADLLLDQLAAVLDGLPVGSGGEAFVFDARRDVVAAPGAYTDRIVEIGRSEGRVATALDLDIRELPPGDAAGPGGAFGQDGSFVVFEREFPGDSGPRWLIHVRATRSGLAPALGAWEGTVLRTTAISALLVLGAVALMFRVWAPLTGMRSRASTDALTGLANRHEFQDLGSQMVASASAEGSGVCLVILDLDGFKEVNDTFGHQAGDDALEAAGQALQATTRVRDLVARIGGDEFAVILRVDDESDEDLDARVEGLRAEVAGRLEEAVPGASRLGATAGYVVDREGQRSLDALLNAADSALIAGKAAAKGATYLAEGA
jgi:diguanylate cyclase (GGDEF)-like protein